jgi:hypothetical protein
MDTRRTAVVVGILFLLGYVGVFLGSAFYAPALDARDFLDKVYPNRARVIAGMLIELVNDLAVLGIGVLLFPILKKYGESLALGYFAFRFVEATVLIVSKISVLSLISLSQLYIEAGVPDASYFHTLGTVALAQREWASVIQVIFFVLGALTLYWALYQSKLVPRFLSVWGLIAVAALSVANMLDIPDPTQGFEPTMLLFAPIFLSEILLAVWLIVKGFSSESGSPAVAPDAQMQAS